jgi:hypothetical protein
MSEIITEKTLQTIIVLRNDTKEAWDAEDSYVLRTGEVGIGYMKVYDTDGTTVVKTVPIFKVGDGIHAWKNLPQAEGVFEKDITLTAEFGKYKPSSAGYVKVPKSKGMTTTEFLMDALSQVKGPDIKAPTFTLKANTIDGDGIVEIGTTISSISWTGTFKTGSYSYGSKKGDQVFSDTSSNQSATSYVASCTPADGTGIVVNAVENKGSGTATFKTGYTVGSTTNKTIASVSVTCNWGASDRDPVNNVGEIVEGKLPASYATPAAVNFTVKGYREGFYAGTVTTAITDPATQVTSDMIRKLGTKSGTNYAASSKTLSIPAGAKSIIIACPKANKGVTDILNTTVNAGMNEAFGLTTPTVISVQGADKTNTYAADYNVWVYTPAEAYSNTASLTIKLG